MKVCLVSFSPLASDARVRRHRDLLKDHGVDVVGVGFRAPEATDAWPIIEIDDPPWGTVEKAQLIPRLLPARLGPRAAERAYWSFPRHRALYEAARGLQADLFVANDWNALPIAARLADEAGARFAYDSHEYAVEERADRVTWRVLWPALIRAIEDQFIRDAAYVTTVSDGIADLLQRDYGLRDRPVVVHNAPEYQPLPAAELHDPMTVLFHGSLQRDRGLELLIDSVQLWSLDRRLVIRGRGEPRYAEELSERASRSGVRTRVDFVPPVPANDVVSAARRTADVGIHPMPPINRQTRFALPNKFFEYILAGLSVVVMADTEMGSLVLRYRNGALIERPTPQSIADVINCLDPETLRRHKEASMAAAAELSWAHEKSRLWSLYARDDSAG